MTEEKVTRYGLREEDLVRENGHVFALLIKMRLQHPGMACLACGIMRRADGTNAPCKGEVRVKPR